MLYTWRYRIFKVDFRGKGEFILSENNKECDDIFEQLFPGFFLFFILDLLVVWTFKIFYYNNFSL